MGVCGHKQFFECRKMSLPLQMFGQYPKWDFLHHVQKNEIWPHKKFMDASQRRPKDHRIHTPGTLKIMTVYEG
jgi:hypothetical protein